MGVHQLECYDTSTETRRKHTKIGDDDLSELVKLPT